MKKVSGRKIFVSTKEQKLLYDLTCLQLWYVFYLSSSGTKTFEEAIFSQTPFDNFLPWYREKQVRDTLPEQRTMWIEFVERVKSIYNNYPSEKKFIAESIRFVFPLVLESEIYQRLNIEERWFGCFRYGYNKDRKYLALHFKNAYEPEYPFSQKERLFLSLMDLVVDVDKNNYEVEEIGCGSWINNLPAFQELFPKSYIDSLHPTSPDDKRGNGWWGQFISHRGVLHRKRASILKEKKIFEYSRLHGQCDFSEFRKHILKKIESNHG
jgi:hypothetical protein